MPAAAPARYLISKVGDPIFALFIGLGAATMRIRREEAEKGRNLTQAGESLRRRLEWQWGKYFG